MINPASNIQTQWALQKKQHLSHNSSCDNVVDSTKRRCRKVTPRGHMLELVTVWTRPFAHGTHSQPTKPCSRAPDRCVRAPSVLRYLATECADGRA